MKNILFISFLSPPRLNAESILLWKTIRYLSRLHKITLVTSVAGGMRDDPFMEVPGNVIVYRRHELMPKSRMLKRAAERIIAQGVDEHYLWARMTAIPAFSRGDFDILYSRSHPGASHILAYRINRRLKLPWVAQFSDPWSFNPYHSWHSWLRIKSDRYYEEKVVLSADHLVFPTVEILNMYDMAYPSGNIPQKSTVLPHHYSPDLYDCVDPDSIRWTRGAINYFGDFYGLRSPQPLITAFRELSQSGLDLSSLKVNFVGNVERKFSSMIEKSPVKIGREKLSYVESLAAMRNSKVLLLIDAPFPTGVNPFLPSKLIDYIGAGRPIIGITDLGGTTANVLRKYGHDVVSLHDITCIAAIIRKFTTLGEVVSPIKHSPEFTTEHVVGRLIGLFNSLW